VKLKVLCVAAVAAGVLALTGCGQKGPLYLPDKPGDVVTRPAARPVQTPPPSAPQPATASPPDQSKPPDENQAK